MASNLYRLSSNDLIKGLVTAVIAALVVSFAGVAQQPGFDLFSADWGSISHTAINVGFATLLGYLGKNFLSDDKGAVLGKFGGN